MHAQNTAGSFACYMNMLSLGFSAEDFMALVASATIEQCSWHPLQSEFALATCDSLHLQNLKTVKSA